MRSILAHQGRILGLAFSADGRRLASTDTRGQLLLWDDTLHKPERLKLPGHPTFPHYGVAFSPAGDSLMVACESRFADRLPDGGLIRWRLSTMEPEIVYASRGQSAYQVRYHPNGESFVATCYYQSARLMCCDEPFDKFRPLNEARADIWQVAISPDGRWVAGAGNHSIVHIWDWFSGRVVSEGGSKRNGRIDSLAFHPNGNQLVAFGSAGAWLWTYPNEWRRLQELSRTHDRVGQFSVDGRTFLSAGTEAGVRVWDSETWQPAFEYAWETNNVERLVVAPDGTRAALGTEYGTILVWDME